MDMASVLGNVSSGQAVLQNCDMVETEHGYSPATFSTFISRSLHFCHSRAAPSLAQCPSRPFGLSLLQDLVKEPWLVVLALSPPDNWHGCM